LATAAAFFVTTVSLAAADDGVSNRAAAGAKTATINYIKVVIS